jgi:hypothetical protein
MRRNVLRWAWPVLVVLLAAAALPAAPPKPEGGQADKGAPLGAPAGALIGGPVAGPPKKLAIGSASVRKQVVQELTAILNETDSAETFLVTTMVLEQLGPAARPAVPAIVRNAERLGLFKHLFRDEGRVTKAQAAESVKHGQAVDVVLKAVETILQGKQRWGPAPPSAYGPADPLRGGSYSAPCVPPSACPPGPPPPPAGGPTPTSPSYSSPT